MDLIKIAAELFMKNATGSSDGNFDLQNVIGAFQGLLPINGGELDLASLVSMFGQNDMGALVGSFLGDGQNDPMSASQIMSMFGSDKVGNFASQLGMQPDNAADSLSSVIPKLIDQNSQGGNLSDAAGKLIGGLFG